MGYRLFLDDSRQPEECAQYMSDRLGKPALVYLREWVVVRSYEDFVMYIESNGLPSLISFDHDLCDVEKTGNTCAKWLVEYCIEKELPIPSHLIHSMNKVGSEAIELTIQDYYKYNKY